MSRDSPRNEKVWFIPGSSGIYLDRPGFPVCTIFKTKCTETTLTEETKISKTASPQRKGASLDDHKQLTISNLDGAAEKNSCPLCDHVLDSINHLELHIRNNCTFLQCLINNETEKIKQFF